MRPSSVSKFLVAALIFLTQAALGRAESKYAKAFEGYLRSGDEDAFGRELREVRMRPDDFREDVSYLVGVMSSSPPGRAQDVARLEVFRLAFGVTGQDNPFLQDIFRPAVPVFERHLTEALREVGSPWAKAIASLTGCVGIQPSASSLTLFYRMVDSQDATASQLALLSLARLRPRPEEAKRILLSHTASQNVAAKLAILGFALDDSEILNMFAGYLESTKIEDQRAAADVLSRLGHLADPALDVLLRLRQRPDLDGEVSRKLDLAIGYIREARQ